MQNHTAQPILVTGATGYVGGRLIPLLLERGYRIRALVRSRRKLASRPWASHPNLEIVEGDLHDEPRLRAALHGCSAAYYLVHSMTSRHHDFKDADRKAAYNMVRALKGNTVERVIYLSGLVPDDTELSPHLKSRAEVAEILALSRTFPLRCCARPRSSAPAVHHSNWCVTLLTACRP